MTLAPGIHEITAEVYHSDPVGERPSLTASIAAILCSQSPLHAWTAHPRLNPQFRPVEDQKFDLGRIAHSILLEGEASVRVIEAPDWRSRAAKEEREEARAAGLTPVLAKDWSRVQEMVEAVSQQLDALDIDPRPFTAGKPEQTIVWEEAGVLCRARLDWVFDNFSGADDLKTTSASAGPYAWPRTFWSIGADVQVEMYRRALRSLGADDPRFRFVVCETVPPYAVQVFDLAPSALTLAAAKVDRALAIWRECLERDEWPGYPPVVASIEMPAWEGQRWLDRQEYEDPGEEVPF